VTALAVLGPASGFDAGRVDKVSGGQWYVEAMRLPAIHNLADGAGIVVAVIDTGVDASHVSLQGRVLDGVDLTNSDAANGQVDLDGHGTAMASLIAGRGRISGVAPAAKILPVRVKVSDQDSVQLSPAIEWAMMNGADVISISMGEGVPTESVHKSIQAATKMGIPVVASAGNIPADRRVAYPAAYAEVLAVCSFGMGSGRSAFSVTGIEVDVCAPGEGISTAIPGGRYAISSGTSNSAAIVAGSIALLLQRYPDLSAPEVINRVLLTAKDVGQPGRDLATGYGNIDIYSALTANIPSLAGASTGSAQSPTVPIVTGSPAAGWRGLWCVGFLILVGSVVAGVARRRVRLDDQATHSGK